MKILGWVADHSACGFYRIEQPLGAIRRAYGDEHHVEVRETLSGQEMLEADLTICQRTSLPEPTKLMMVAATYGARLVYEVDDLLLHLDPANPIYPHYQQQYIRDCLEVAVKMSTAVTVSTDPLAAEMRELHPHVYVLENRLPDYFAALGEQAAKLEHRAQDWGHPRLLWAGSATHHGDFTKEAQYGLRRALEWGTYDFTCMGFDYRKMMRAPEGKFIEWSDSIPAFHESLVGYDVGLCPLASNRFNSSKSGLKAMEYQAAGIVPVASDCEAYRGVIEDGVDGFLCSTQVQWKDALMALCSDVDLLVKMKRAALAKGTTYLQSGGVDARLAVYREIMDLPLTRDRLSLQSPDAR